MTCRDTSDCQRPLCPMPGVRVQGRIAHLSMGDELTAICSDPGEVEDIPAWCRTNNHEVVSAVKREGELLVAVRVGG
ncbi:MAG: sulfurtransferase TusA family protein [Gammaproteobacteria bacterium]|nr:sulfurtransferase TusA family protein [Gammaproteobacteria bacterium]